MILSSEQCWIERTITRVRSCYVTQYKEWQYCQPRCFSHGACKGTGPDLIPSVTGPRPRALSGIILLEESTLLLTRPLFSRSKWTHSSTGIKEQKHSTRKIVLSCFVLQAWGRLPPCTCEGGLLWDDRIRPQKPFNAKWGGCTSQRFDPLRCLQVVVLMLVEVAGQI